MSKFSFKKVAWISSRSYPDYEGGAEITEYVLMREGRKQGLKIDYYNKNPEKEYDLYLIGNTHDWRPEKVFGIIEDKKFVFFSHDPLIKEQTFRLLKDSFLVIFMSPAHRDFYLAKIEKKKIMLQPPAFLDIDKWHSAKKEKHAVYIGDLNEYKGVKNLYRYAGDHPKITFKVFGRNSARFPFTLNNFHYYGWLPTEDMPKELAKAKYFIHLPSQVDPGPHMVIKAYLSGCELVINKNVGVLSYKWNWDDPEEIKRKLKEKTNTFWTRINKFCK